MGKLFGTDGIRDKAGAGFLTPQNVQRLGTAVSRLMKPKEIAIARDTRQSGKMIESNLIRGLANGGEVKIKCMGVMPTPALAYLTKKRRATLGVVISASHNPFYDNGIKFFSSEGVKIPDSRETKIEKLFFKSNGKISKNNNKAKVSDFVNAGGDYINGITSVFKGISLSGLKIVLDCANGATFEVAPKIFSQLNARVVVINNKPNGRNINDACGALYPAGLCKKVVAERADIGIAFDGDGDRAILVDGNGVVRDGDYIMAICAGFAKGGKVVGTVMANFGLEKYFFSRGIKFLRTQVGDKYVYETMCKEGASLGGEQSGHIIFSDIARTGDGIVTALKVLEVMVSEQSSLAELSVTLKKVPQVLINVKVNRKPDLGKLRLFPKRLKNANAKLGRSGRILVRYSGTEPLARVMVEGEKQGLIKRIANELVGAIQKEIGL